MATDVSIAISAKDNYTQVIQKIEAATKTFATDISGLQGRLDKLNKTRTSLQINVTEARNRVRELTRELNANGAASDETKRKLQEAEEEYQAYASALREVQTQAKETERSIRNLNGTTGSIASSSSTSGTGASTVMAGASIGDIAKTFFSGQIASQMLGTVGGAINTQIASAYGDDKSIYAKSIGSSALSLGISGANIGTSFAPGIGTAIGAVAGTIIGVVTGAIQGNTQIFEKEDDYFKSIVKDQYDEAIKTYEDDLEAGKTIAGGRETDMLAFERLLGGEDQAQGYLDKLVDKAAITPFGYNDLTSMSKTLATFGYTQDEMLDMINKVGDTGAALGMDASGMVAVATYLGRMKSSGKTTLEYLNPLIERGIPVMDYLAESLGKSRTEVYDMVSKGLIPGEEAAKVIADYMGHDFAGSMEDMSHTYDGMLSTIEDYEAQIQNAMGNAYNEERKSGEGGLQYQIDWYEKNADEMAEMYAELGKWTAEQDNTSDKLLFDTYSSLIDSDWRSMDKGELYTQLLSAKTEAEAKYMGTEEHEQLKTAQLALVKQLQYELEPVYEEWGYAMMQAFTKGRGSVDIVKENPAIKNRVYAPELGDGYYWDYSGTNEYGEYQYHLHDGHGKDTGEVGIHQMDGTVKSRKHAFGFSYVPYDDYPAMLHQGERVLTASQNREYSRNMGGVSVIMNGVTVREEADIDRIADELYFRIRAAAANYSEVA